MKRRRAHTCHSLGGKEWELELECGHKVRRRDRGKGPPSRVDCEECLKLLDRLRAVRDEAGGGWKLARQLRALHQTLRFLEAEGRVESSTAPHATTQYWRLRRCK